MNRGILGMLVLLAACAGCGLLPGGNDNGQSPHSTSATGAKDSADPVPAMVVLDASGSMTADDAPGSRFDAAQQAVDGLVGALDDGYPIGLLAYGTSSGNSEAAKTAGCRDVREVVPFGALDPESFRSAVDELHPRGYTPIGAALTRAAAGLPASGKRVIVLVSDGIDTCAPPQPCAVAQRLHRTAPDLVIHTVGFKVEGDAQRQLHCIASATGGEYLDALNGPLLGRRLAALFDPDLATHVVRTDGYRNLTIGMTVQEARKAAGLGAVSTQSRVVVKYVDCTLVFEDGVLTEIRSATRAAQTVDGLRVGDDVSDVVHLYGDAAYPSEGSVTVTADPVAGTGYVFDYDGNGSTPGGAITTITVCRCLPRFGSGMVAWSTSAMEHSRIYNGTDVVTVQPGGGDQDAEDLVPVGFVGGNAVFADREGAHQHVWKVFSVDPADGSTVASVDCETCDQVLVHGDQIIATDGYGRQIRWFDEQLRPVGKLDLSHSGFRELNDYHGAGDPPPSFTGIAVTEDAVFLTALRSDDPISFRARRIARVDRTGAVTWSGLFHGLGWVGSTVGAVTSDGQSLVVSREDGGLSVFDSSTLRPKAIIPADSELPIVASSVAAPTLDEVLVVGAPCKDAEGGCEYGGAGADAFWNGTSWEDSDSSPVMCRGSVAPGMTIKVIGDETGDGLFIERQSGGDTQVVLRSTPAYACVVDGPLVEP